MPTVVGRRSRIRRRERNLALKKLQRQLVAASGRVRQQVVQERGTALSAFDVAEVRLQLPGKRHLIGDLDRLLRKDGGREADDGEHPGHAHETDLGDFRGDIDARVGGFRFGLGPTGR